MLNIIIDNLIEYVEIEPEKITESINPISDLNLTSYDFVTLVGKLESELGIEIPEHDLRKLETLGDLDRYLRQKLQQ